MILHLFKKNSHTYTMLDNDIKPTIGGSDMSIQHLQLVLNQKAGLEGKITCIYYEPEIRLGYWQIIKIINITPKKPFQSSDLFSPTN